MKKSTFLLTVFCFSLLQSQAQLKFHQKKVKTTIEKVKVFLSGAAITRNTILDLPEGRSEITFTHLEGGINSESVMASIGEAGKLLSVSQKTDYINQAMENPEVRGLADSIEVLILDKQDIKDESDAFDIEKKLMTSNMQLTGKQQSLSSFELKQTADLFRNRILEINSRLSLLRRKEAKLKDKIATLRKELSNTTYKLNRPDNQIIVAVDIQKAGKIPLTIEYLIYSAGWAPKYDIRSSSISQPISLEYWAGVGNRSGIDWDNVNLTLSTQDPTLTAQKPSFSKWVLRPGSVNSNLRSGRGYQGSAMVQSQMANSWAASDTNYKAADITFVELLVSDVSMEYVIPQRYSIPADGKPYLVDIREELLPATYGYFGLPREDRDVFLIAKIKDWEKLNLIEGPAYIYNKGTYVGQSKIKPKDNLDALEISLGRDQRIVMKREKIKDFCSSKIIGPNKKETLTFDISVKNMSEDTILLNLWDQIPITSHTDIKITLLESTGASLNEESGSLNWNLKLLPTASKKVRVCFAVRSPIGSKFNLNQKSKIISPKYF